MSCPDDFDAGRRMAYDLGRTHAWAEVFVILHAYAEEKKDNALALLVLREFNRRLAAADERSP